jgi:thymidylate kinase
MSNLITFSGLDGAGKTTQISLFLEHLERESTSFSKLEMYDDISVAALVRRKLASKPPTAAAGSASAQPAADTSNGPRDPEPLRLDKNRSDLPTVVARQFVYLLDLQRFLIVRRRHATEPDGVLVMDRYFFDSLANLLTASDLAAPYVSLFLKLAPTPRLAVLLDVAPETAFRRKREYPLEYLRQRRSAYHKIFARVETAFVLDGEQEPEMVHQRLIERAGSVLHKQELSSHV